MTKKPVFKNITARPKLGRPKKFDGDHPIRNTVISRAMEERVDRFLKREQEAAVHDALAAAPKTMSDAVRILIEKGLDADELERGGG